MEHVWYLTGRERADEERARAGGSIDECLCSVDPRGPGGVQGKAGGAAG